MTPIVVDLRSIVVGAYLGVIFGPQRNACWSSVQIPWTMDHEHFYSEPSQVAR